MRINSMLMGLFCFASVVLQAVAVAAAPVLPPVELKTSVSVESKTYHSGRLVESDRESNIDRAIFLSRSSERYTSVLQFYQHGSAIRGRFCALTTTGSLVDCFTILAAGGASEKSCLVRPYDEQRDRPNLKQGYTQSDINRALVYLGVRSQTIADQLYFAKLGLAGHASNVRFQPFSVDYISAAHIPLAASPTPQELIRARGVFACQYYFNNVAP